MEVFEQKEKFNADTTLLYPGMVDTGHKAQFTKLINLGLDNAGGILNNWKYGEEMN